MRSFLSDPQIPRGFFLSGSTLSALDTLMFFPVANCAWGRGEGNHGCTLFNCWISLRGIPGHAGGQGYEPTNPPTPPASGSHCSNVRTLCSRPLLALKIRGVRAQLCQWGGGRGNWERERPWEKGDFWCHPAMRPNHRLNGAKKVVIFSSKRSFNFHFFLSLWGTYDLLNCQSALTFWALVGGWKRDILYISILHYRHPKTIVFGDLRPKNIFYSASVPALTTY